MNFLGHGTSPRRVSRAHVDLGHAATTDELAKLVSVRRPMRWAILVSRIADIPVPILRADGPSKTLLYGVPLLVPLGVGSRLLGRGQEGWCRPAISVWLDVQPDGVSMRASVRTPPQRALVRARSNGSLASIDSVNVVAYLGRSTGGGAGSSGSGGTGVFTCAAAILDRSGAGEPGRCPARPS